MSRPAPGHRSGIVHTALLWSEPAARGRLTGPSTVLDVTALRRRSTSRTAAVLQVVSSFAPAEAAVVAVLAALAGLTVLSAATGVLAAGLVIHMALDPAAWKSLVRTGLHRLRFGDDVYAGEGPRGRLFVPSENIGALERRILVPHGHGWALDLASVLATPNVSGALHVGARRIDLTGLTVSTLRDVAPDGLLAVTEDVHCRLQFGAFTILLSGASVAGISGPTLRRDVLTEAGYLAASGAVHAGAFVLFIQMAPEEPIAILQPRSNFEARLSTVEFIQVSVQRKRVEAAADELPEPVELADAVDTDLSRYVTTAVVSPQPENTRGVSMRDRSRAPARPTATRPAPTTATRAAPSMLRSRNPDARLEGRGVAEHLIPTDQLASVITRPLAPVGGPLGIQIVGGGAPALGGGESGPGSALAAHTNGPTGGGYTGLQFGPTGPPGNPDPPSGTVGGPLVAALDKSSLGPRSPIRLSERPIKVSAIDTVEVPKGGLTRDIVRNHLDRQKGQLVTCYRRAVQSKPDLAGKVVLTFTILPTGRVSGASVLSSTLGDASVQDCMVNRASLFRFPPSPDGTPTRVRYPLDFRTTGGR
ncbi:MAG: energy transducer TonB [Myxococcales bacterium]|nr:energy transducer TonB [Myxococcales bacterium]